MDKVLVPALVAAFVTLLIEYVAKPRLEARKERILERHRDTRALVRAYGDVERRLGAFLALREMPEHADRLGSARTDLVDRLRGFHETYFGTEFVEAGPLTAKAFLNFTGVAGAAIWLAERSDEDFDRYAVADLDPLTDAMSEVLHLPRWRWRRRRLASRALAPRG